jgi:hypothetical protein
LPLAHCALAVHVWPSGSSWHVPLPSQTTPPPSLQGVPGAAFTVPHALLVHALVLHVVICVGQSLATRHATQVPLPSQTLPPLSLHALREAAFATSQQPPAQELVTHSVLDVGQSLAVVQAMAPSHPSGVPPAPLLEALEELLLGCPPAPAAGLPLPHPGLARSTLATRRKVRP